MDWLVDWMTVWSIDRLMYGTCTRGDTGFALVFLPISSKISEPFMSFSKKEYSTTVFEPSVDIQVDRKGGDLSQPSEVDVVSEEGKLIEVVYFGPGETSQTVVLKSLGSFNVSHDVFRVYLNNSQYARTLQPSFATVMVKRSMNFTVLSSIDSGERFNWYNFWSKKIF